jgi:hypothetical protein
LGQRSFCCPRAWRIFFRVSKNWKKPIDKTLWPKALDHLILCKKIEEAMTATISGVAFRARKGFCVRREAIWPNNRMSVSANLR